MRLQWLMPHGSWWKAGQDFRVGGRGSSGGITPVPPLFTGMREAPRGQGPASRSLKGIVAASALALTPCGVTQVSSSSWPLITSQYLCDCHLFFFNLS